MGVSLPFVTTLFKLIQLCGYYFFSIKSEIKVDFYYPV